MNKAILSTAAASVVALLAGLAGPASAAGIGVQDPADTGHGSDLRSVVVRNNANNLVVITTHTDLRPSPTTGSGGAVYVDTDPTNKGPERVFVGGFFQGTDYQLLRTDGFGVKKWGEPVNGSWEMTVNYVKDRVRFRMAQPTLGTPDEVRIAVRVAGTRRDGTSNGLVDWLGEPKSFTEWVARG